MNLKNLSTSKRALIIGSVVILLGVGIIGITIYIDKKNEDILDKNVNSEDIETAKSLEKSPSKSPSAITILKVGEYVAPNGTSVNVRQSASTDSGIITNIKGVVGKIVDVVSGSDGYKWYKVQLLISIGEKTFGYVRSDVVQKTTYSVLATDITIGNTVFPKETSGVTIYSIPDSSLIATNNVLKESYNQVIGKVLEVIKGSNGKIFYKVELALKITYPKTISVGYVLADKVTKEKSSMYI